MAGAMKCSEHTLHELHAVERASPHTLAREFVAYDDAEHVYLLITECKLHTTVRKKRGEVLY